AGRPIAAILAEGGETLERAGFRLDYLELRDAETLRQPTKGRPLRLLAAATLGRTRLIDNVAVPRNVLSRRPKAHQAIQDSRAARVSLDCFASLAMTPTTAPAPATRGADPPAFWRRRAPRGRGPWERP